MATAASVNSFVVEGEEASRESRSHSQTATSTAPVLLTEVDAGGSYAPHDPSGDPSFEEAKRTLLTNNGKLKLPHTVSHIALRESFLSEAPFVVTANRSFWRKMIDNVNFQDMLCYTYYFLVSCISDTAVVDLEKLAAAKEASYIKDITKSLAQLYLTIPRKERDMFFPKCPEILAYLLINAMRTAAPKHHRLMGMCQFREILLDWATELIGGLRLTNCRLNREWFFSDAIEGPILTHPIQTRAEDDEPPGVAKRKMLINRSPLIDMFCDPMRLPRQEKPRVFTISHNPKRNLLAMQPSSSSPVLTDTSVRYRHDTMSHRQVKSLIGRTLRDHNKRKGDIGKEVRSVQREGFLAKKTLVQELRSLDEDRRMATMRSSTGLMGLQQSGDQRATTGSILS